MTTAKSQKTTTPHSAVGDKIRMAGHKIDEMSEHAGDKSDEVIKHGHETAAKLQKEVEQYTDTVANYIKKNPLKSALIAGGIGLIVGRLLKN